MPAYVDALVGEAGRYGRGFFFGVGEKDGKLVNRRHWDVSTVVSSKESL